MHSNRASNFNEIYAKKSLHKVLTSFSPLPLFQNDEQQRSGKTRSRQHKNVRGSSAKGLGRERFENDIRGIWSCTSNKRAEGQIHGQQQRQAKIFSKTASRHFCLFLFVFFFFITRKKSSRFMRASKSFA